MGLLQSALGGLLAGAGEGLADAGKAAREYALKMLDEDRADKRLAAEYGYRIKEQNNQADLNAKQSGLEHGFRLEEGHAASGDRLKEIGVSEDHADRRNAATLAADAARQGAGFAHDDAGIASQTVDADGNIIGITRTGARVNTGVKAAGLSPADQKIIEIVAGQHTVKVNTKDPDTGSFVQTEQIDTKAVADQLARVLKRPDLAKLYTSAPAAPAPAPSPGGGGGGGGPANKLPTGVTPDQALQNARDAIKNGKDRNAVIQRLQSWGINPAGL